MFRSLGCAAFVAAALGIASPEADAHWVQAPCDFLTAGGFVFKDNFQQVNFGAHGGCKDGKFWRRHGPSLNGWPRPRARRSEREGGIR